MDEYQLKNFLKFAPSRLGIAPKKHLLVHVPKNGGMAIREASSLNGKIIIAHRRRLKSKAYADGLLDFMKSIHLHPGYEHARLRDIDLSVRAGTIPFAVIRNPWGRTFSRYKFYLQTGGGDLPKSELSIKGFDEFLETRHEFGGKDYFWHRASLGWYPQTDYVIDEAGSIAVDILRQEYLSEEVSRYFKVDDGLEDRNVSRNAGASYKDFYTDRSIQTVADWYASDLDMFGFDFDTAAQKGTLFATGG
ncbi:hypothetical protein IWQ52_001314 [Labrenzia sp. EL_159]|uniref:hypothetical protein n=1 Tax=Roseibium album TaxID=311410 RepID=UPI000CF18E9B|nr:hypothetical protein [Roseibium album]MBG6147648.1 hypothetical protein [Labrenzia sp. EL_142]MBG6154059.1 hypothetical protein [Labrenzia sp. EL_162]MBG6164626.1 hypothetical protein [Labrenzia sp. EL_195]MBG6193812.1 hypothetical protein [Labrenzia sp. EL_159]MCR9060082.1 hypothetical protein [Paracoccaceae bacterium]